MWLFWYSNVGSGHKGKSRVESRGQRMEGRWETGLNKNPGQPRESSYGECLFCPQLFRVLFVSLCFSSPRKSQFCPLPYAQPHFSSRPGLLLCLPTLKATLQSQSGAAVLTSDTAGTSYWLWLPLERARQITIFDISCFFLASSSGV